MTRQSFSRVLAACLIASVAQACAFEVRQESDSATITQHPVRQARFWRARAASAAGPRRKVQPAPPEILDFLDLFDRVYQYPGKPKPGPRSEADLAEVEAALAQIPQTLMLLMGERFQGVFLARDIGITALGQLIVDEDGKPWGGFIALDANRIKQTANQWRTEHERLFFGGRGGRVEARIASETEDSRVAALRWILLHELGHLIPTVRTDTVPVVGDGPVSIEPAQYRFMQISWRIEGDRWLSRYENALPFRGRLSQVRVGSSLFGLQDFEPFLGALESTSYPTLYAATNPWEDFSDSLAAYVNTAVFHQPYEVRLLASSGEVRKVFKGCLGEGRCPEKAAFLRDVIQPPDPRLVK